MNGNGTLKDETEAVGYLNELRELDKQLVRIEPEDGYYTFEVPKCNEWMIDILFWR